ncbi:Rieske 2Fe-2S domain-containing protein [Candidatus Acetothermia bacterium]|nr:Rieske 2Fe-2S domain-containing protein [Candidatus Acetothermia bacterium]MBI3643035.1 Rieske 2Fe-2S domain-containing protein [Candidatus Acetothermia bacterium]
MALTRLLAPEDFYVDPDIRKAETLPMLALWDPDFLALELATIFKKTWLCVPKPIFRGAPENEPERKSTLLDILEMRGNAVRFSLLNESLFLKRDFNPKGAPALHCFSNLCPHAFYPLLQQETDESRSNLIRCQQHGLVAECDGRFRSHPAFPDPDDKTQKQLSLTEYPLEEWGDSLFICRGEPIGKFQDFLGEVQNTLAHVPFETFRYMPQLEERRLLQGNWKQHAWNYLDSLHIGWIHKAPNGLQDALEMASYQTEFHGYSCLQWAYAKDSAHGFDPVNLPARFRDPQHPEKRVFALWWFVFPNLALNFYPWGLSINVYMPVPDNPGQTEFLWYHYVWNAQKYMNREAIWLSAQVDLEDVDAMRRVWEGLSSKSEPMKRGLFGPERERGPHWFHRLVYELVSDGQK